MIALKQWHDMVLSFWTSLVGVVWYLISGIW